MRIGIDVSQLAYSGTGVANYLSGLVLELTKNKSHEYVLFFSSFRRDLPQNFISEVGVLENVKIVKTKLPPTILDLIWNRLHILPIETFVGKIDIFISSDWSEPPSRAA